MDTMEDASPVHDYYPLGIQIPNYAANESSPIPLIARFGLQWLAVLSGSFFLIGRLRPKAGLSDRVAFTWMCLSISLLTFLCPLANSQEKRCLS